MGIIKDILPEAVVGVAQAVTRGGPRRQYKWNKKAANDANEINRANQQWLLEQNRRIQEEQREYDSPSASMARLKAAGINPHLFYSGGGSSAGGAFPIDAGSVGSANIAPPSAAYPDIAASFLGAGQTMAQTALAEQRTSESKASEALKEIQTDIAKTNPMLNPGVVQWVSSSMMEAARLKSFESRRWMDKVYEGGQSRVEHKIDLQIEALAQRLGLNTVDLQIKNKILESKEFENAVKEVQASWLKDGDLSPEHIRQGLMLLLTKMLGR